MEDKKITFLSVNKIDLFLEYYPSLYREYYFNNYIVNFINLKSKKITVYKKKKLYQTINYSSFFQLYRFLKNNRNSAFVSIEEKIKNIPFFYILKKLNINTYYVHAHENYPYISFSKLSFFSRLNKYLISINAKIFNLLVSTKIIGPINTLFSSSQNEIKYSSFKKKNFLFFKINYKKFKNIIKINNKELYKVSNKKKKNNIIFLDIAAPFHKDQIYNGYKPIDENFYYTQMNRLLIMISKYIDCKVIIFPHPKYKKKSRLFSKNFKIVNQNQESYLKKSKIVFIHHTSAIFKAVNFKIKILQIQSKKFNSFIYKYNNFFKKKYSLESIDLEEQNVFKIKKKFLKSSHFYKEIEFNDKIDNIELISNFVSKNEK